MNYLAVELALWERLTGAPLDNSGLPKSVDGVPVNRSLPGIPGVEPTDEDAAKGIIAPPRRPSYGVRIPRRKQGTREFPPYQLPAQKTAHQPPLLQRDYSKNQFAQIPVIPHNQLGQQHHKVWPLVTFHFMGIARVLSSAHTYDDYFTSPVPTAPNVDVVTGPTGEPSVGKDTVVFIPPSEPQTLMYGIRVYARYDDELKLIMSEIHRLFPAMTGLDVLLASGDTTSFSMRLTGVEDLSPGQLNVQNTLEQERQYSYLFIYEIDARSDVSLVPSGGGYGQEPPTTEHVITQRILELQHSQDALMTRTYEFDKVVP
jgi:hypothetical protein